MVTIRLEQKPAFTVAGTKTWIAEVDDFAKFWQKCHDDGSVDALKALSNGGEVTGSDIFGVSRVENAPDKRDFFFYIAAECAADGAGEFETFTIPAAQWAIFQSRGSVEKALFEAEMYAFMEWLPSSGYIHAAAPELEVYPARDGELVEFWLPVDFSLNRVCP